MCVHIASDAHFTFEMSNSSLSESIDFLYKQNVKSDVKVSIENSNISLESTFFNFSAISREFIDISLQFEFLNTNVASASGKLIDVPDYGAIEHVNFTALFSNFQSANSDAMFYILSSTMKMTVEHCTFNARSSKIFDFFLDRIDAIIRGNRFLESSRSLDVHTGWMSGNTEESEVPAQNVTISGNEFTSNQPAIDT